MQVAINKAEEARRILGTDPEEAVARAGLSILSRPLEGRLRAFYSGDFIVHSDALEHVERRELLAHELGHHLLHEGIQWNQQGRTYSRGDYRERQANVFAAFYLIPETELAAALPRTEAPHALAEEFAVPEKLMRFRLALHAARMEALT